MRAAAKKPRNPFNLMVNNLLPSTYFYRGRLRCPDEKRQSRNRHSRWLLTAMVVGVDPVKASTLLSLEQRSAGHALLGSAVPEARRPGPWVRGLDTRFRGLWRGGMVIGIGATDAEEEMMRQEKVGTHS
jgi:hypothetical protein